MSRKNRQWAARPVAQVPPIQYAVPPIRDRRFWPEDDPLPDHYVKLRARRNPCPKCRRLLLDDGGQATCCTSSARGDRSYFRCKSCGHRWSLPVDIVEVES